VLSVLLAVSGASSQQKEQVEQGQVSLASRKTAGYTISRLPPAAFPQLSGDVRAELEKRGCLVPQTVRAKQPENVISGHYRDAGTTDWAAVCSRDGYSSILVFWKGSAQSVEEIGRRKDTDDLLASSSKENLGYARFISSASPERIQRKKHNKQLGPFNHEGIEDGLLEKGSLIHYFRGGEWVELEGRD
jgi:hypothetical protein